MTVKQRLIEFAKSQGLSTRALEAKCGLTIGYINAMRVSISPEKLRSIVSQFPQLNPGWVITGEGEMLNIDKVVPEDLGQNESEIVKSLMELINSLRKVIDSQVETISGMQRTIDSLISKQ